MAWGFWGLKNNLYYSLDIGTESVKALIFDMEEKKAGKKAVILGWGVSYFDNFDISGSGDFNRQILEKAVTKAIDNAKTNSFVSSIDKKTKDAIIKQKKWKVIVGLSPTILKAKVKNVSYVRKKVTTKIGKTEEEKIYGVVCADAKKEVELEYLGNTGILGNELYWKSCDIVDFKIDGYKVETIRNYKGENLNFKILLTFLPQQYLKRFTEVLSGLNLELINFIHISEAINKLPKETLIDGFYVDIGGDATQIIGVAKGTIRKVSDFERGVSSFAENVSVLFGIDKNSAYDLLENYSKQNLGEKSLAKLKEVFASERLRWYVDFKRNLGNSAEGKVFSSVFRFFGGGIGLVLN